MKKTDEQHDTYIIPPNFIEGGTLFGGMFKFRNVIEAGILAVLVGVPIFSIQVSLTVRIIILCLTALPLALFALIGISGEPLSSYIFAFFKWLKNRRIVSEDEPKIRADKKEKKQPAKKQENKDDESMLAEIVDVIRKRSAGKEKSKTKEKVKKSQKETRTRRHTAESNFLNPVAESLPIEKIENGVIYTKDHRYIKVIEVVPINFMLRSAREQRSIIYSFISYLKISPVKIQFKVLTKRADLNKHTDIVRREMELETDPNEFLRACRNTGGEFIQISPASKNCINVMEIRKTDKSVDELLDGVPIEKSELAAKIQQLHIFFSLLIPDITHEERQLLDEALIKTYHKKGITHDNESLEDPDNPGHYREMPILGDLYDILITAPETKRMANILNRLVHGSASTFNQQTNVNLDNKYTVLDISELSGDLLTVGMFVALDYVWDKAKQNRTVEKTIFIDECWALIGGSGNRLAANFVLEIAKIIRGYGGSAVFATQDLNDFFALDDGKYGKGIINNCKTKIVLNLEDEEAQRVQSILHLSEAEVMEITHFERGNGLISTNNNNITVEFRCSDLEKSLITTDRRELQELVEQKKAGIPS